MAAEVLDPDVQIGMLEHLVPFAQEHVDASEGKLVLLEIEPTEYPDQIQHEVEGTPVAAEYMSEIGRIAVPRYPELMKTMQQEGEDQLLAAAEFLEAEGSVQVQTSHKDVIDTAYGLGAPTNILRLMGVELRSEIWVGKMLTLLAYDMDGTHVPTMLVLKSLFDKVHLSFPRSKKINESPLMQEMPNEVAAHNELVKTGVNESLTRGGVILGASWSGTTSYRLNKLGQNVVPAVNKGTADTAMNENSVVLPVTLDIGRENPNPYIEFSGKLRKITDMSQVHELMTEMTAYMTSKYQDGRQYVYEGAAKVQNAIKDKVRGTDEA